MPKWVDRRTLGQTAGQKEKEMKKKTKWNEQINKRINEILSGETICWIFKAVGDETTGGEPL